jgi:hypothetical protein
MITSAVFTPLYAPGLRKVIFESYTYLPTEYDKFLNVGSSKRQYEEDYRMGGFGAVPTKAEGTAIVYDDPVPDAVLQWDWTPYGKGFRATHEAMADELYGQLKKLATAMGRSFKNQAEVIGASILNNAFTAIASITDPLAATGYDALPLCSTAHTLLRGGTNSNRSATDADLGVTSLQDALIAFERFVDESNRPTVSIPKLLIVAPENMPVARELLGSQFKPYTADNEVNIIRDEGLQLMVTHHMTDTARWFLQASKSELDLWMVWREKFMTEAADDFDTGDGKMKGYMRLAAGWGDWRHFWGSDGT